MSIASVVSGPKRFLRRAWNRRASPDATKTIRVDGVPFTIVGGRADPFFRHVKVRDDFLLRIARRRLRPDATIFDIGANIGVTACMFARFARGGKIFCFEPGPASYAYLQRTLAANAMPDCRAVQLALGAEPGMLSFVEDGGSASASHVSIPGQTLGAGSLIVEVSTVDREVSAHGLARLDFLKIDVEGFELDVIDGAAQAIASFEPDAFVEFNSFTLIAYRNINPRILLERLLSVFPHVYAFEDDRTYELDRESRVQHFVHQNLLKRGSVDDLFCSFSAL